MSDDTRCLPERTVLVHIGPHKTGTTMLQGALNNARSRLVEHGVVYPGKVRQHVLAAQYLNGKGELHIPPATKQDWDHLVGEISSCKDQRVIVSSEFFCESDTAAIQRLVNDFDCSRVHVLVTVRPLAKILPSAWQQYVRNRVRWRYADWLNRTLNNPPDKQPTSTFWMRHHHEVIVERWASVVGAENVTVVVVDGSDRQGLLRTVEGLVDLPEGLLEPDDYPNRSLTYGEAEMVRLLNEEFKRRRWSNAFYRDIVQDAVARRLQKLRQPPKDEPAIPMPQWALKRAAEIGSGAADRISTLGVRIIGDISVLGAVPDTTGDGSTDGSAGSTDEDIEPKPFLYSDGATQAVMAAVLSGRSQTDPRISVCSSRHLASIIIGRVRRRFGRARRSPFRLPAAILGRRRRGS